MTSTASYRRPVPVALALFAVLSACLVGAIARAPAAHARQPGPYLQATQFRPDGVVNSAPATVTLPNIGRAVFVLGSDGGIWWSTPTMGWASLGQPTVSTFQTPQGVVGAPAVVSWGPGRIDVFVQSQLGHKLWQTFTTCSGCAWSPWIQPVADGVLASPPAATSWAPGRIDILVVGTDGNLYQRNWDTNAWSPGWFNIGSPGGASQPKADPTLSGSYFAPAVTAFTPGRLDIFIWTADNKLWQTYVVNNTWQGWFQPPGTSGGVLNSAPRATWWNGGGVTAVTVFVKGTDNHLYQATYDGGPTWGGWTVEGAPQNVFQDGPEVQTTLQAQPYVLVWGTDGKCYQYG